MDFIAQLQKASKKNRSLLCVGLDPDIEKIPTPFKKQKKPLLSFNKHIIDSTRDLVCSYKPNSAFYEALGRFDELRETILYIKKRAPLVPVILDAKRGDIGNTAAQYARYSFEYLRADAVTLNPYMGFDSMEPFLQWKDKGAFILCLTSNAGAKDFQQKKIGSQKLYQIVAGEADHWRKANSNVGIVVGATKPDELLALRKSHPKLPFLVPGLGAQGGSVELSVKFGTRNNGLCIFNVSRQVLFPSGGKTPRQAAMEIRNEIQKFRKK